MTANFKVEETGAIEVAVAGIGKINLVQIQEAEVDELERVTGAGQQALAFCLFTLGGDISTAASWLAIEKPTPMQAAVYGAATLVLTVLTGWFGLQWRREHKLRLTVFSRIRRRMLPPAPAAS